MREIIIIIATIALMLFSSCESPKENNVTAKNTYDNGYFVIQEIDSCEYVLVLAGRSITHKGNCKYCLIRNKKWKT